MKTKNKKETRGGTRQGSGAKPLYKEPTKVIPFRFPISKENEFKERVMEILKEWRK